MAGNETGEDILNGIDPLPRDHPPRTQMSPATTHASVLRGSDSPCSSSIAYVIIPTRSSFKPRMRIVKGAVSSFCWSFRPPKQSFWFFPARIRVFSFGTQEQPSIPGIVRGTYCCFCYGCQHSVQLQYPRTCRLFALLGD